MSRDYDEYMAEAIRLAKLGHPHPNPRVGAVLVRDGAVIGRGYHEGPGLVHAEVAAIADARGPIEGSTMYVTLEPCAHHGRTPPCADAIIEAGIARVVVGEGDPDSRVAGAGISRLREAGVSVVVDVIPSSASVDPAYHHHRRTGRAMTTLKAALTLDGQSAAIDGTSQWITSPEARQHAHELRADADAILVGAGTVIADDPLLNVRIDGYAGPQPRPVIVAGTRPLPPDRKLFERNPLVFAPGGWKGPGEVLELPSRDGRVDLESALVELGERGYLHVLVEGGAGLAGALWKSGLVDRGVVHYGAKLAGGVGMGLFAGTFATLTDAEPVLITDVRRAGPDIIIEFSTG